MQPATLVPPSFRKAAFFYRRPIRARRLHIAVQRECFDAFFFGGRCPKVREILQHSAWNVLLGKAAPEPPEWQNPRDNDNHAGPRRI